MCRTFYSHINPFFIPAKGRECNNHADCSALQHTSCVKDLDDDKLRCLCGDNLAPVNGLCTASLRGKWKSQLKLQPFFVF